MPKGVDIEYEPDKVPYVLYKNYIPDFKVTLKNGYEFFIEVKGYLRTEDIVKMLAVKRCNPGMDIRFVFQRDGKIPGTKYVKYSTWARKNGFEYAIGQCPKDWFK